MRVFACSAAFALAMMTAACGSGSDTNSNVSTEVNLADDAALNAVLGVNETGNGQAAVVNPVDAAGFTAAVASIDLFEIESGRLAQAKAMSADLKSFGLQLVTDHSQSTVQLKAAAAKSEPAVTVRPALNPQHQAMIGQLKGATGADFDRLFIDQQTRAHGQAMDILQDYGSGGDQESLRAFADNAAKTVQAHLSHVNTIKQ